MRWLTTRRLWQRQGASLAVAQPGAHKPAPGDALALLSERVLPKETQTGTLPFEPVSRRLPVRTPHATFFSSFPHPTPPGGAPEVDWAPPASRLRPRTTPAPYSPTKATEVQPRPGPAPSADRVRPAPRSPRRAGAAPTAGRSGAAGQLGAWPGSRRTWPRDSGAWRGRVTWRPAGLAGRREVVTKWGGGAAYGFRAALASLRV